MLFRSPRVEYQLPNLIVGAITKESLYGAFDNGITAEQVSSESYTSSGFITQTDIYASVVVC